jgi:hypothetical protein
MAAVARRSRALRGTALVHVRMDGTRGRLALPCYECVYKETAAEATLVARVLCNAQSATGAAVKGAGGSAMTFDATFACKARQLYVLFARLKTARSFRNEPDRSFLHLAWPRSRT